MIRKTAYIIVSIALCFFVIASVFGQKRKRLRIEGEIMGYDKLSSLENLSSAPWVQTFILRVNKVIKGNESEPYIIIVHRTFNNEILNNIRNGNTKVKLKLKREKRCDSSIAELRKAKLNGKSTKQEGILFRIEWLRSDVPWPTAKMPCYLLDTDAIFVE